MRILGLLREQPFDSESINDLYGFVYKLPIQKQDEGTSEENIFGHLEPHQERNENKNKNLIGRSITVLVQN